MASNMKHMLDLDDMILVRKTHPTHRRKLLKSIQKREDFIQASNFSQAGKIELTCWLLPSLLNRCASSCLA